MARIGDSAICCALCTSRALRRASPKRAPPNSWSAQTAASRPSPTASGATTGAGAARRVRHAGSKAYIYTALRVSGAACRRSWRPRPQVSPTRTQFAARTLAPVCSVWSTNVSSSQGRYPYTRSQSSPTERTARPSTCEARLRHTMPGRTSSRHSPNTRCRCARRPASSHPTQASRDRSRRALAANPTPPSQPCAEPTRYRSCAPTNGPAPRGCS